MSEKIVIVGGGLAGLSAAYHLEQLGYAPTLLEATDRLGGRIQSDQLDGYILDHGFQIVISTYKELLDLCPPHELGISFFPPGAMIRQYDTWVSLLNPLRKESWLELRSPFLLDFLKIGSLYLKPTAQYNSLSLAHLFKKLGLSDDFYNKAARPFFAGVYLDPDLKTSAERFMYNLPFITKGKGGLPREGMGAIPLHLAGKLKRTTIEYKAAVERIEKQEVVLTSGKRVAADRTLLALPATATARLLSLPIPESQPIASIYFSIDEGLFSTTPFVYLEEDPSQPINNFSFLNLVQASYAPKGKLLVVATVLNREWQAHPHLEQAAAKQLSAYFPVPQESWEHLKTYHIPHAAPDLSTPPPFEGKYRYDRERGLYLCGEMVDHISSNNSIVSGKRAAEAIHKDFIR